VQNTRTAQFNEILSSTFLYALLFFSGWRFYRCRDAGHGNELWNAIASTQNAQEERRVKRWNVNRKKRCRARNFGCVLSVCPCFVGRMSVFSRTHSVFFFSYVYVFTDGSQYLLPICTRCVPVAGPHFLFWMTLSAPSPQLSMKTQKHVLFSLSPGPCTFVFLASFNPCANLLVPALVTQLLLLPLVLSSLTLFLALCRTVYRTFGFLTRATSSRPHHLQHVSHGRNTNSLISSASEKPIHIFLVRRCARACNCVWQNKKRAKQK
jgi:hypothetical protein